MSNFPDFSNYGYQVIQELGHNRTGGRVTYLANRISPDQEGVKAVIKQFQFAQLGASWAEYETYEQEIKMLRSLNHPGIPRYLDSFQTDEGFCMVQEYINATPLSETRSWTPQQLKQLALCVLEILLYLQNQTPPVIHRDIKPENILVNDQLDVGSSASAPESTKVQLPAVYLVDFGFARSGGGEVAVSSVIKGTLGFMPPEQLFNRELSAASDLYGLGVTLICLLTGTKSVDIGNLIDNNYRLHFRHLVPPLQRGWLNWLEKMVEPRPQDRYPDAAAAIAALKPIDVSRLPKVRLERNHLEFTASEYGEKLTQIISISNPIPDTVLSGRWEVAPHPSDSPHTPYDHDWISFQSQKFEGNLAQCEITVDTSKLLSDRTYTRQILLHTNSSPDTHTLTLQLQTAPLIKLQKMGFGSLFISVFWRFFVFLLLAFWLATYIRIISPITSSPFIAWVIFHWLFVCLVLEIDFRYVAQNLIKKGLNRKDASPVALLITGLGFSLGSWFIASTVFLSQRSFIGPFEAAVVAGIGITQLVGTPLLLNYYLNTKRARLIAKYRRSESHLIKP
jgi:serine/threonine protein kinase